MMLTKRVLDLTREFQSLYLSLILRLILVACLVFLAALLYFQYGRTARFMRRFSSLRLHTLDILGHLHISLNHRFGRAKLLHRYHVYDFQVLCGYVFLCRNQSVLPVWQLTEPFAMIYKADLTKVILNHSTQLEKAWPYKTLHPWLGTGLLTSHGEKWKQRRRMLTPTFHFEILKNFLPGMNHQANILVDILKSTVDDEWVDFGNYMTRCSLDIICETTLGVKVNSQIQKDSEYLKAVNQLSRDTMSRLLSPWLWPDFIFPHTPTGRRYYKNLKTLHDFTKKAIAERKREILSSGVRKSDINGVESLYHGHKKRAFLDFLLEEHLNNNSLTEEDIREEVDTFTFEGHDTTAVGMTWAAYLIGLYPNVQRKIHEELEEIFGDDKEREVTVDDLKEMRYLERVLKEAQRLYPSVPVYGRALTEDITFQGKVIPKGVTCGICVYMLHRDPDVFPEPEIFDPDRFSPENSKGRDAFAYVPFSAGPRNCIGQRFAMMEEKVVLSTLLRNCTLRSLDHRDKIQVVDDIILRPCMPIRIQIRLLK